MSDARPVPAEAPPRGGEVVRRHRLSTRIWHWVNALTFFVMLMSGLMIFNAHPRLYWGQYGANSDPAWLQIGSEDGRGYLRVGEASIDTTGVLGTRTVDGRAQNRAFPGWATIPSDYDLALARRWHLTFAWVFALGLAGLRLWQPRQRPPAPRPAAAAGASCARATSGTTSSSTRGSTSRRARRRGTTTCCRSSPISACSLVLIPLMVLTGLTMSPGMDATWPWLLDLFGGRQSARSIHFIAAWALVRLHRRPPADGGARRAAQRDPLDDHRPLPPAEGEGLMARAPDPPQPAPRRRASPRRRCCSAAATGSGASPSFRDFVLGSGEWLSYRVHRLIGSEALAREFDPSEMSPSFRTNGNTDAALAGLPAPRWRTGFADWRLRVDGLVERRAAFSLAELQGAAGAQPDHPARLRRGLERHRQVDRRRRSADLLEPVRLRPEARYIVFHCADDFRGTAYYESIDLVDAFHPQTILAYGMNDADLPVGHGAPLRLRVERQLGYKHAKFVMRVEAVASLDGDRPGQGRLLGGHGRLRLVRRDLSPPHAEVSACGHLPCG